MPGRWLPGLVVAALAALATGAQPVHAISRADADRIALRALEPEDQRGGRIAVYRLPRPVGRGTVLAEGDTRPTDRRHTIRSTRIAGGRAWIYWMDLANGAAFAHPSVLLAVDDATGRVALRRRLNSYPLVNGRFAAFLRSSAVESPRYLVYSNRPERAAPAPRPARRLGPAGDPQAPLALPPGAFANDCILAAGATGPDTSMRDDFAAIRQSAQRLGVRYFNVGGRDNGRALRRRARVLVTREGCRDILIYVHGHGAKEPAEAGVETAGRYKIVDGKQVNEAPGWVTPRDIQLVHNANPEATFKLKVDSCYAGRFADELPEDRYPRLLVTEASSARNEVSYLRLPWVIRNGARLDNFTTNPGVAGGEYRSEFTHRNVVGWERFATSQAEVTLAQQAGGSLFARMLARGFALGEGEDFAFVTGQTHPVLVTNFGTAPPPQPPAPPGPPAPAALNATAKASHRHVGPGDSRVCWRVTTSPAVGGNANVAVTGPAVVGPGMQQALVINGDATGEQAISDFGTYRVSVEVRADDGRTASAVVEHTVGSEQGTCPPPP